MCWTSSLASQQTVFLPVICECRASIGSQLSEKREQSVKTKDLLTIVLHHDADINWKGESTIQGERKASKRRPEKSAAHLRKNRLQQLSGKGVGV